MPRTPSVTIYTSMQTEPSHSSLCGGSQILPCMKTFITLLIVAGRWHQLSSHLKVSTFTQPTYLGNMALMVVKYI